MMSATLRSSLAHSLGWTRRGGPFFTAPAGTILAVWGLLIGIAVIGSGIYGASLALVVPVWEFWSGAAWLILSAGFAWVFFIPALAWAARESLAVCFHVGLLTMAAGEGVLMGGALVNVILWSSGAAIDAATANAAIVAVSNVVMVAVLAALMRERGVAVWKSVVVWMVALNGSGAALFVIFARVLLSA